MGLLIAIANRRVYLDANVFIYALEGCYSFATALAGDCEVFLTNDLRLKNLPLKIDVLALGRSLSA